MRDLKPLVFGVLVSTVLAGTLVIAGLKAGITPGVSPLVILCAWGAFARQATSPDGRRFLNITQVAGSAGMAVTAGVIFTAPLLQILHRDNGLPVPPVDVPTLILVSLAGSLMGFGYVGLATRKFLTDPTLPAPEARACEAMIEAAVTERSRRPLLGRSLFAGIGLGFLAPLLARVGLAKEHVVLHARSVTDASGDTRAFQLDLPLTPIYIGIGGLLTLATALLVAGGSFLRLLGDFGLATMDPAGPAASMFPGDSMRWVGGGAMTVAVAYSLLKLAGVRAPSVESGKAEDERLLFVDPVKKRLLTLSVVAGLAILFTWLVVQEGGVTTFALSMTGGLVVMCALMVTLGAILSLQIGSSASPVSGTVFVTTLVLCLIALAVGRDSIEDVALLTPLLVGACVAVCAANDSSQDYKTLQLCRVRVQDGFLAQILGLVAGSIVVPIALYVADRAYTLGSDQLVAPQGKMFATLVDALLVNRTVYWAPIAVGLAIGGLVVSMEIVAGRRGHQLPSMALAVGIYLPAYLGVGILVGAACRWFAERGSGVRRNESILAAAGLITGAAALELLLGTAIVLAETRGKTFDLDALGRTFTPSLGIQNALSLVGIAVLGGLLYANSKTRRAGRSKDGA